MLNRYQLLLLGYIIVISLLQHRNSRKFSIDCTTLGLNFLICKIRKLDQIRSELTLKISNYILCIFLMEILNHTSQQYLFLIHGNLATIRLRRWLATKPLILIVFYYLIRRSQPMVHESATWYNILGGQSGNIYPKP